MGKAAKRRKAYHRNKLVALSYENPQIFAEQWDMRLESWLIDVRKIDAKERAFDILDNALSLLDCCEPKAAARVQMQTYNELCNACSLAVAGSIDPRLYKLSNFNSLKYNSKKGKRYYGLEA
jgi:hypothetical protein